MRLLYYLLPAAVALLAGCADRTPATEARVGVSVGYMPSPRRAVEDVGQASKAVPNMDLNKLCRAVERSDTSDKDRRHWCLEDERDAKNELQRRWHTLSAAERSACMPSSTGGVEPSYVELLTCLELVSALKDGPSTYGARAQ